MYQERTDDWLPRLESIRVCVRVALQRDCQLCGLKIIVNENFKDAV